MKCFDLHNLYSYIIPLIDDAMMIYLIDDAIICISLELVMIVQNQNKFHQGVLHNKFLLLSSSISSILNSVLC